MQYNRERARSPPHNGCRVASHTSKQINHGQHISKGKDDESTLYQQLGRRLGGLP